MFPSKFKNSFFINCYCMHIYIVYTYIFQNTTYNVAFTYVFGADILTLDNKLKYIMNMSLLFLSCHLHCTLFQSTFKMYSYLAHLFTLSDILSFSSTYCPIIYINTLSAFSREYLFYSSI